jgi:hypothetical protein
LVLLLDGLDEVRSEHRAACVAAINAFRQKHGLARLAICCRSEDYTHIHAKLELHGAVYLKPLTPSQVHDYLRAGGELLSGLREAARHHQSLLALAQRPLMLSIMTLAYSGKSSHHVLSQAHTLNLNELFADYVSAMFDRLARTRNDHYSRKSASQWLSFLARQLIRHNQTQFLLEDIQSTWLRSERHRRIYEFAYVFISCAVFALPVGLTGGLAARLVLGWNQLFSSLTFGIPSALAVWLAARRDFGWRGRLIVGLSYGTLMTMTAAHTYGFIVAFSIGVLGGIAAGLGFGMVLGSMHARNNAEGRRSLFHLVTVDKLSWSWRSALRGLKSYGLPVGGATFVVIGLAAVLAASLSTGLVFALVAGVVVTCTCGVLLGLTSLEIQKKSRPNQGVWMSLRNAVLSAALASIVSGLPVVGIASVALNPAAGLSACIGMASYTGLGSALFFGGGTVIGHFTIRTMANVYHSEAL